MSQTRRQPPELLAPAGDWDCVRAAVENGADAVYFGLECGFNARARAKNFQLDDLGPVMEYLHQRAVKGYVTLNTLAFPTELSDLEHIVRAIAAHGVDAVLIQDVGVARLVREVSPDLPIHASTQMTLTSSECIEFVKELGISRVVLARELSIAEIAAIRRQTTVPLEAFVHGALCVAYSGQCLTSESLGGRSANRGQCAQACRLPYELVCDGNDVDLKDIKYLLSPQDLAAFELTPDLLEAGICSFKIEGRLKTPEYVANITKHYRQAIDDAFAGRRVELSVDHQREMELSFSRGFSPGWLKGCDHKMLVPGLSSAKRGVLAGTVVEVCGKSVIVEKMCDLSAGDGVVFAGDREAGDEQGGRIFAVIGHDTRPDRAGSMQQVELTFGNDCIDFGRIAAGQLLWKTDDPKLNQRLRQTFRGADPLRRVPLDLRVTCGTGMPIHVTGRADNGASCDVVSHGPLAVARKHKLHEAQLRQQLGRLGATVYELRDLDVTIEGEPMVPLSVLGKLRREMITQLDKNALPVSHRVDAPGTLQRMRSRLPSQPSADDARRDAELFVLCRTLEQLHAAAESNPSLIYAEFPDIREYREAVAIARAHGVSIYLATPRIQKPDEMGIFQSLRKHEADGMLIRNLAGLDFFASRQIPVVADFSLNVANDLTAEYFVRRGAQRVTASYDLNRDQLFDLVAAVPSAWLEVVMHQHMPMFHMEHCVFCAVLSPGTNKTNCGRPCDSHRVELRDRIGMEHPLTADVGCRNTLYNAVPQSSAEIATSLLRQGIRQYRVELLREDGPTAAATISLYQKLLAGETSGKAVWQRLQATNRVGVTRGTLEDRRNPLAIL